MRRSGLRYELLLGILVLVVLVFLESAEYVIGITVLSGNLPVIAVLAVARAAAILVYFMHIMQLKHPGE